ncbi:filamentous hemagglutinin N-terminal domain-containing protein [Opitutales bacterium]|nr:filamentous hemagglutinin N-terminal domain-containing protein [Opitutales bacterium]
MSIKNILFFFLFLPLLSFALPNPNATEIQVGNVSFESLSKELQITASDGAHIQYFDGLNISEGETVRFIQPSIEATVINEIMSEVPTQIDGNLFGNGKVVLLNSSGIVFGGNAVVDVGKLHAIAGSDLLGTPGYGLSGTIENNGLIQAGEVMLAGSSVANRGTILVENGIAVLAAGGSFDLLSQNGDISVSLSAENAFGAVTDLAGQAVLQSGVVQASKAQFYGNQITHSGSVSAQSVTLAKFSAVSASQGSVSTNALSLSGGSDSKSGSSVDLSTKTNQVSTLSASGYFDSLAVRSSSSLTFGEKPEVGGDFNTLSVQNLDLRVDEGDLNLNQVPVPSDFKTDNALLLASKYSLVFAYDVDQLTHARKILYGQNLSTGSIVTEELKLGTTVSLDASSVSIDELSSTLSASAIQSLAKDNPTFEGFDNRGGLVELSSMTSQQLELLFQYGLFTGYSYFLQGPSDTDIVTEKLANAGGTSAVFGGSLAVVASSGASGGGAASSSSDSSGSGDSGSDSSKDSGDSDSDSSSGGGKDGEKNGAIGEVKRARALGAIPFAPITTPIASPPASAILESALTAEIESRLSEYLDQ